MDNLAYLPRNEAAVSGFMSDIPKTKREDLTNRPVNGAIRNVAVVQCEGFRCLAYRDMDVWRDFQSGKELPEVKSVVFTFSV